MRKRQHYDSSSDEPARKKTSKKPSSNHISPAVDVKPGIVLTDILGKKWKLGKTVGTGGFGQIYLASDIINHEVKTDANYVAKVESHRSGPLFVELNCYLRIAKQNMIEEWKQKNKIKDLGMPHFVAAGSHKYGDTKYRFLIIPRFKEDLEEIFESKKFRFNLKTVLTISLQIVDILNYIHSKGYVHCDIKASNIMLSNTQSKKKPPAGLPLTRTFIRYHGNTPLRSCKIRKSTTVRRILRPNYDLKCLYKYNLDDSDVDNSKLNISDKDQVYLVDYGLASKYLTSAGVHKEFCSDERKAHAGTILFCSRDAHSGAQSRRSDLESLGYNMIYWLTSGLPWSDDIEHPEVVQKKKCKCIENVDEFLNYCFLGQCPQFLYDYFRYLKNLNFQEKPDYEYCKNLFKNALREYGYKDNCALDFDNLEGWGKKPKQISENVKARMMAVQKLKRMPLTSNLPVKPMLRKRLNKNKKNRIQRRWSKILMDPEGIIKRAKSRERKLTDCNDSIPSNGVLNLDVTQLNPTAAMICVFNKALDSLNNSNGISPWNRGDCNEDYIEGYTYAMMAVYNRKKELEELAYEQIIAANKKKTSRSKPSHVTHSDASIMCKTRSGRPPRNRKVSQSKAVEPVAKTTSVPTFKKESSGKPKAAPLRRTYSLRG